ncbi:MAG: response regulator [bacterium]
MNPHHILIIDDDPGNKGVYRDLLNIHGFETRDSATPSEALAILADRDFGAVIIDLRMHSQSIIELASMIKTSNPFCCVIILTNDTSASFVKSALRIGAEACLIKPFIPFLLLETMKRGIERVHLLQENERLNNEFSTLKGAYGMLKDYCSRLESGLSCDPATGLLHPRALIGRLTYEVSRAQRHEHWLSLTLIRAGIKADNTQNRNGIMCLVDLFKKVIRTGDIMGHHGAGLALIMPETDLEGAHAFRKRIMERIVNGGGNGEEPASPMTIDGLAFGTSTYPIDSHLPKRLVRIAASRLHTEPVLVRH